MLNIYKYFDDPLSLPVTDTQKQKAISSGDIVKMMQLVYDTGNRRFPEAEPYIMKDPGVVYIYAKNIIKGRWQEAEPDIITNPFGAYMYAREIIKGRWEEAEPYIKQSKHWWKKYSDTFGVK